MVAPGIVLSLNDLSRTPAQTAGAGWHEWTNDTNFFNKWHYKDKAILRSYKMRFFEYFCIIRVIRPFVPFVI
jgi:hypothetical protein